MDLEQRKANLIYEIASIIHDDPSTAPILIEELVSMLSNDQLDQIEDVITNQFDMIPQQS